MLGAVLHHTLGEFIVHIRFYAVCRLFLVLILHTDNLDPYRASGWERLRHCFGLEADSSFRKDCRVHATRAFPRVSTLFVLEAQHIQTLNKRIGPIFTAVDVSIYQTYQIIS